LKDAHGIRERPPTSDESTPVGLELQGLVLSVFKGKTVRNIYRTHLESVKTQNEQI
jgi:hypothetical protein